MSFVMDFVSNSENKFYLQIFEPDAPRVWNLLLQSDPMKKHASRATSRAHDAQWYNGVSRNALNPLIVFLFIATFAQFAFVVPDMPVEMGVRLPQHRLRSPAVVVQPPWLIDAIRNKFDTNGIVIINKVIGSVVIIFSIIALFGTIFNLYHLQILKVFPFNQRRGKA